MIIGLTGSSGSGKTTACEAFRRRGALVLDCDELVHTLGESDGEYIGAVKSVFGDGVINSTVQGESVNRKKLGEAVFSNADKLEKLNKTVHPIIHARMKEIISKAPKGAVIVIDAPQLFEAGAEVLCDTTLAVICDASLALKRIMARDGISAELAEKRMKNQKKNEFYIEKCENIIYNNGSAAELEALADKFYSRVTAR